MADPKENEVIVPAGEQPPETIIHTDGKRYRPTWRDASTDSDKRRDEARFAILAMGDPVEDEDEE
jgi:hypothetical protein